MRSLLRGLFASSTTSPERTHEAPPKVPDGGELRKDPVCGTYVSVLAGVREKVKGETVAERAKSLAKIRDTEGYMSQFVTDDGGPQILECHTPLQNVLDKYPIIGRLEQEMFEQLLGTRVRRQETRNSGLYECTFYFDA